uniref:Si:ch211-38m6.6 n=1 Tax=Cyprinus carpio TaxID=7962 RepID=A0A8C1U242_CYPCA
HYFLGLGLSAFSFSVLVSGPVFGHWSDKTRTTKNIILFSDVFEIVGNFMYFMGYSKWLLLSSRLVAGIGAGAGSSIFGFLTRTTLPDERAGLLIGPAFNIFLRLCDFKLGPFVVNKYTLNKSVLLFMCGMWVLMQFAVMVLYWDIPPLDSFPEKHMPLSEVRGEEDEPLMSLEDENRAAWPEKALSISSFCLCSAIAVCARVCVHGRYHHYIQSCLGSFEMPEIYSVLSLSVESLREEVVVLLTAQFITLFNQTALETMVTPLTQKYFGFGELGNSVMYSLCVVEVIAGFFLVRWLSRVLEDRVVLAVGLLICSGACVWCLIFLANPQGVVPAVTGRFSKVTAEKTQGLSQNVRRSVGGLVTILGPLWAGGLIGNLYGDAGYDDIMMVLSYEKLVEHAQHSENGG